MNRNIKAILIISAYMLLSIIIFSGLVYLISNNQYKYLYIFIGYIFFVLLLPKNIKYKHYPSIHKILLFPISVIYFILSLIMPFIALLANIITYIFAAGVWLLVILSYLKNYNIITISYPTIIYISATFISIISIVCREILLNFTYNYGIMRVRKSEKMNRIKVKELTDGVITRNVVRFSIYSFYFIYIVIFSLYYINNIDMITSEYDKSIIQAFITFLAFDNIVLNCSDIKTLPTQALTLIYNSLKKSLHIDDNE